jgi:hypothetical protein
MAYFFILLGAVLRVIPHPGNFAPIAAMALFGGANLGKKQALLVPLAAMVISDFFIGFDGIISRAMVYGSFLAIGLLGIWLKNHKNIYTVVGASLAASVIFFLVTNLPLVHPNSLYPYTWEGAMSSYFNAIPFFKNTLLGDLFYTSVFFGAYELVRYYSNLRAKRSSLSSGQIASPVK